MKVHFAALLLFSFCAYLVAEPIPGFEDSKIVTALMAGEVLINNSTNTNAGEEIVGKSFFKGITTNEFIQAATDYTKLKSQFPEITYLSLQSASADKKLLKYVAHISIGFKITHFNTQLEGVQEISNGPLAGEVVLKNSISNYKTVVNTASFTTRLIPYQNGLLVEDKFSLSLVRAPSAFGFARTKLRACMYAYTETMKKILGVKP